MGSPDRDDIENENVPKITINGILNLLFKVAISILLVSNHNSFRVMFDKIASVYFIWKINLYFSVGNGQPMEPALCQLYWHTFVCNPRRYRSKANARFSIPGGMKGRVFSHNYAFCIVVWPSMSCFADWSKRHHVTLSIIMCSPLRGHPGWHYNVTRVTSRAAR